jgi:hypothetical protein
MFNECVFRVGGGLQMCYQEHLIYNTFTYVYQLLNLSHTNNYS